MKNKGFWFWGFIILLLLNLSIISSISYYHYRMIHNRSDYDYASMHKKMSKERMDKLQKKFWGNTHFTPEERQFLADNRKEHFARMKKLKIRLKENQAQLFEEIRKSVRDSEKVSNYENKILDTQKAITEESISFYEKMKAKLSAEQMEIVNRHLKRHFNTKYSKKWENNSF